MASFTLPPFFNNFSAKLCNPLSIGRSGQDLVKFDSTLEQSLFTIGSLGLAYLTWGVPHFAHELVHWQNNIVVYHTGKDIITVAIDIITITIPPYVIKITRVVVSVFQTEEQNEKTKVTTKRLMTEEEEVEYQTRKKEKREKALTKKKELEEAEKERMLKILKSENKGKNPVLTTP